MGTKIHSTRFVFSICYHNIDPKDKWKYFYLNQLTPLSLFVSLMCLRDGKITKLALYVNDVYACIVYEPLLSMFCIDHYTVDESSLYIFQKLLDAVQSKLDYYLNDRKVEDDCIKLINLAIQDRSFNRKDVK